MNFNPINSNLKSKKSALFEIAPNPSTGKIMISHGLPKTDVNKLTIHNQEGRQVFAKSNIDSSYPLDFTQAKPGVYTFILSSDYETHQEQMIIRR